MTGEEEDLMSGDEESETLLASQKIKLITAETLLPAQREDLCKVMEQVSRTLLIHYHWDCIGLQLIPSPAPSVGKTCTKMVAATW
jgi:hypothetical protein